VIARFEAERQALAVMDHPNVAKVFDGGATETGRPYFVMELVRGTPITAYCDANTLSIRARLELFAQVCQAVQHAHQKGLIHRDIKPSNILVSTQDDRPVAKVIDFGIAKATQARLTEKTLFTEFRQMVGTPEYMSPEQTENSLDIDTRSDVYSLGVLLYELLAGCPPFDPKELRSKAFAEMQRIIREVEPPPPSTRLSRLQELPAVAAQRGTEPKKLSATLRGELDWIVMKALEKDRSRRYETANDLARDVERYLRDDPVLAFPPSAAYRFHKFARRNKSALLVAATMLTMLLLLVAGLTVSNVRVARQRNQTAAALNAAKANAERAELQRQRARSNLLKARTAMTRILAGASGYAEWSKLPPQLRKGFSDEAALYYKSMIHEGSADPDMRFETAVGYRSLGFLHSSAHELEQAEKYYRKSIEILEALLKDSGSDAGYGEQLSGSNLDMAALLEGSGRTEEAERAYREAIRLAPDDAFTRQLFFWSLMRQRKVAEAERVCREWLKRTPDDGPVHYRLANVLLAQNRLQEAIPALTRGLAITPQQLVEGHNDLAWVLTTCSDPDSQHPIVAVTLAKKAIELDPASSKANYRTLGVAHYRMGKWEAATAALEKSMELREGGDSTDWFFLAMCHRQLGDEGAARKWYDKAVVWMDKNQPDNRELARFRTEAATLLGISEPKSSTAPSTRP
jgi:tetratricopeptide (TPR) repeat protein